MIYKTLHRKVMIEQHEPHSPKKTGPGVNSSSPEELEVLAPQPSCYC